jgi:pilus assembly protein Flp/PilA
VIHLRRFVADERGQDLVEYAFLVAFIALACIVGMQTLGSGINAFFGSVRSTFVGAGS